MDRNGRAPAWLGALWGLAGYGVLWEGAPVTVSRPFVESALGTLLLLPPRLVIWAILGAERLAGRTFDLADSHAWIAPAAAVIGAIVAAAAAAGARRAFHRFRR